MNGRTWAAWIGAMLFAAGCGTVGVQPRFAAEPEVLAALGEPVRRWANGDGTTTLEYSTQPYGHTALMLTLDAAGMVIRQADALAEDNLARVEPGMTRAQIGRLLGQHRSVQVFALSGEEVWDWNVRNDGPGIATYFNVHFIDGRVVRTSRSYEFPREGPEGGLR